MLGIGPAARKVMGAGLYPLKFKSIFKETPWGGSRLREVFSKETPRGVKIGEAWEIVDRTTDNSVILNGPCQGTTLHELLEQQSTELLGVPENLYRRFPLLVKFIDATGRLSLQVHPDDDYASTAGERDGGKMEAWHVVQADPGSWIVHGLKKDVPLELLEEHLRKGAKEQIESCLNFLTVDPGDTILIPPGTPHAAGNGLLLLEVQQNSDLTYRLYDWGSNRPLHLEKALEVIRTVGGRAETFSRPCPQSCLDRPSALATVVADRVFVLPLLECREFVVECVCLETHYELIRSSTSKTRPSCHILTFLRGRDDI